MFYTLNSVCNRGTFPKFNIVYCTEAVSCRKLLEKQNVTRIFLLFTVLFHFSNEDCYKQELQTEFWSLGPIVSRAPIQ